MVPVVFAARGEGFPIGPVGAGVKHLGRRAIAGDALALQISDMPGDRRRAELCSRVAHDAHLDDDAAHVGPSGTACPCCVAAPEARSSAALPARSEASSGVSGLLCGAHYLAPNRLPLPAPPGAPPGPPR